jgi:hypothetical protein
MEQRMKLLCNAIPKSGTYLLAAIAGYCQFKDDGLRFVEGGVNVVDNKNKLVRFDVDATPEKLNRLSDGCYAPCHLAYSDELASFLKSSKFKHLFMYRHPADTVYAYARFVAYSEDFGKDNREFQNRLLNDCESDEDRFTYIFHHFRSAFNFETSVAWLKSDSCYPIKFEDLYEELLNLENGQNGKLFPDIFRYLKISAPSDPRAMFSAIYGVGPTFMAGEKNKIGQYKKLDKKKISSVINDPAFVKVMDLYQYSI